MHLSDLSIRNFRNFKSARFIFNEGINTIIGENGSGKTNVLHALRLILDESLPKNSGKLQGNDFNRSLLKWNGHWIIICATFEPLGDNFNESLESLIYHNLETNERKAKYTLLFRPNKKKREELYKASLSGSAKEIIENITIDDYVAEYYGKTSIDITNDLQYMNLVGDFENLNFPNPNDDLQKEIGVKIPNIFDIHREFNFSFIPATRDVIKDFRWNPRNPLMNLLKSQSENLNNFDAVIEQAKTLNQIISESDDVASLTSSIQNKYSSTVGKAYSSSSVKINSELPEDEESLFKNLTLYLGEPASNFPRPLTDISLGEANLIYISLKLLEFELSSTKNSVKNFLVIEEPEAHIHTHIQRTLFNKVIFNNTQIIYSTHSTQISSVSNIENDNIIVKKNNSWVACRPSQGLSERELQATSRYLDAVRSDILFARGVILVEGDAEEILIPILFKNIFGITLDEIGVVIANVGSTGFDNIAILFNEKRIIKKCSIITDLDSSYLFNNYIDNQSNKFSSIKPSLIKIFSKNYSHPVGTQIYKLNETFRKKIVEHENSQKSGSDRKNNLTVKYEGNEFISIHYATHTFEIDLAIDSICNRILFADLVPAIYSSPHKISDLQSFLNSEENYTVADAAIGMAKYYKKGWFALLLSSKISKNNCTIPKYIIDAIVFAADIDFTDILPSIFEFRGISFSLGEDTWQDIVQNQDGYMQIWQNIETYIKDENLRNLLLAIGKKHVK